METTIIYAISLYTLIFFPALGLVLTLLAVRFKLPVPWALYTISPALLAAGVSLHLKLFHKYDVLVNYLFLGAILGIVLDRENLKVFFFSKKDLWKNIGIGVLYGLLYSLLCLLVLHKTNSENYQSTYSLVSLVLVLFEISIGQEILFRGFFMGYLRRFGIPEWPAILIQALFFTFFFIARYYGDWLSLGSIALLGIITGYITFKRKSIIPALLISSTANLVLLYFYLHPVVF